MQRRIPSCDWQKQQYLSHLHSVSGLSHCEQRVVIGFPSLRASRV
jgi:hypothetical protein